MAITIEEELLLRYFMPADRKDEDAHFLTTTDILIKLEEISKKQITTKQFFSNNKHFS